MARPIRRVVTGHRTDGRSTVLLDGPAPNVKQRQAGNASTPWSRRRSRRSRSEGGSPSGRPQQPGL
jgi:hypothetical protein